MRMIFVIAIMMLLPVRVFASTTISVTSTSTGTVPFQAGLAFKKGDVATTPTLDLANYQITVKKLWNDGSVKHAVAAGYVPVVSGVEKIINVSFYGTPPGGTDLTSANITSAAPSASVQLGSIGTVSLGSLLSNPKRTWISGPEMVECHYQAMVGTSTTLSVLFQVRLYKNGQVFIRAWVDNGFLDVTPSDEVYVPIVTIGGTVVYNNNGSSLSHRKWERWCAEGWIGISDPEISLAPDISYLKSTKLVPNYNFTASEQAITGISTYVPVQSYTPMGIGNISPTMGSGGYHHDLGVLPRWDATYLASGGDRRAYKTVIANAKSLFSYPILRKASSTNDIPIISDWAAWTVNGTSGAGSNTLTDSASHSWENAHHSSGGYLAYLLTGDYYFLDLTQQQAVTLYLCQWAGTGNGLNRIMKGETRAAAWAIRTLSQTAALSPSSAVANDIISLLNNNINYWKGVIDTISPTGIGYFYEYNTNIYYAAGHGLGSVAPWQQHYFIMSLGMGGSIDPLANMANYNLVRDYLYKGAVGILGDSSGFCFNYAMSYTINTNDGSSVNVPPGDWYTTWKDVEIATASQTGNLQTWTPGVCGNTLQGTSGGSLSDAPAMGTWGELLPAISYAVQDDAPGAAAAWSRLTGATNFSDLENSGFEDIPTWGIYPLTITPQTCGPYNLNLCTTENCTGAGGYWYNSTCNASPESTCADGVKNGMETGVDCGGSCSACVGSGGLTNTHLTRKAGNTYVTRKAGNGPVKIH